MLPYNRTLPAYNRALPAYNHTLPAYNRVLSAYNHALLLRLITFLPEGVDHTFGILTNVRINSEADLEAG